MSESIKERLLTLADEYDARASKLETEAAGLHGAASALRTEAERLTEPHHGGNMTPMVAARRVSQQRLDEDTDPLTLRASAAGYTLRMLGEKAGCSHTLIISARKGKRRIRRGIVDLIERLCGFRAILANWPGGIIEPPARK